MSEINVKEIRFVSSIKLEKTIKCNYRIMGKKFGKLMGSVAKAVGEMTQEQIDELDTKQQITLQVEGQDIVIERDDVDIFSQDIPGWSVVNDGTLTVALDLTITDELKREAIAREIVKRIQTYRKDSGFEITDHVSIMFEDKTEVKDAVVQFKDYICSQVLCDKIEWSAIVTEAECFDLGEFSINVKINKIN